MNPQSEITSSHPVRALMTTPVATVEGRASLRHVAETLHNHQVGALVVIDEGDPAGIVSERDVITALAEEGDPDEVWAIDVIGTRTLWADPDDSVLYVARLMRQAEVRHVPIKHGEELMGIVSLRDILGVLLATGGS